MSPGKGKLRIRRDLRRFGLGWLQISAHTRDKRKLQQRDAIVTKLIDDAQVQVLAALKSGRVKIHELVELDRRNELTGGNVLANITLNAPLWTTWDELAPLMGARSENRKRYAVSRKQLAERLKNTDMKVGELLGVDWQTLSAEWPNSASDWNHVRRAISRLLSVGLGDKYHPRRREIVAKIPLRPEAERVPDVTPAVFWRIVNNIREDIRPVFVTLAATGLRVRSEFLLLEESSLLPATHQIRVPGDEATKPRMVSVAPNLWPWIRAAVPSPLKYKALREHWTRACADAEVQGVVIHDLRHCHAQWATDAGAALTQVQVQLGHATPTMSARYARQKDARAVAGTIGDVLKHVAE